jgi:hypothetical protein
MSGTCVGHFFRERAETFMSREGREKMIEELKNAQKLFDAADERLTEVSKLATVHGRLLQEDQP